MQKRKADAMVTASRCFSTLAAASVAVLPSPTLADITFSPAFDVRQVVNDNTRDGRSARGYLELGAAFDLAMDTKRVDGVFSYRYARRIEEFGNISRNNRHNANANIRSEIINDFLFLDAGGSASQFATDFRGFTSIDNDDDSGNQTQVFSGYVQPSVRQRLGNFANFNAQYRLGAVTADGPRANNFNLPGRIGLDPSDGLGSLLTDSVTHSGGVTVAGTRGTNRINWSLDANATLEDIDQLNQEYRGYTAGGELGFQLTQTLEILGSAGYEDIENTQDSILFDTVTGEPVLDVDGNLQIDPAMPRRTALDISGVYWNGGFRYAPSRRTQFEFRAGERYDALNIFADLSYTARNGMVIRGNFSQGINSFSRLLTQSVDGVPFDARRVSGISQFGVPFCILGIDPALPDNECLLGLTQSLTPATFRSDRGTLSVTRELNALTWSATFYFDKRRFIDVEQLQAPGEPRLPVGLLGDDESFGVRGRLTLRLDPNESLTFDTLLARNRFALSRDRRDTTAVAGVNYSRRLTLRMSATATLYGTQRFSSNRRDSGSVTASAGLRYRF